jgi:hypothetical protein
MIWRKALDKLQKPDKTIHIQGAWKSLPVRIMVQDDDPLRIGASDVKPIRLYFEMDRMTEIEVALAVDEGIAFCEVLKGMIEQYMERKRKVSA